MHNSSTLILFGLKRTESRSVSLVTPVFTRLVDVKMAAVKKVCCCGDSSTCGHRSECMWLTCRNIQYEEEKKQSLVKMSSSHVTSHFWMFKFYFTQPIACKNRNGIDEDFCVPSFDMQTKHDTYSVRHKLRRSLSMSHPKNNQTIYDMQIIGSYKDTWFFLVWSVSWRVRKNQKWLPDICRLIIFSELGFIWNRTVMVCCVPLWIKSVIVVTMFSCRPILDEATLIGDLIHLFNSPGTLKYPCICANRWRLDSRKCSCIVRKMIEWIRQTWVFLSVVLSSLYWCTYLRQRTNCSVISSWMSP